MIADQNAIENEINSTLFTHQSPATICEIVGQKWTNGAYVQCEEMQHIVDS